MPGPIKAISLKKICFFLVLFLCFFSQGILANNPQVFFRDWARIDINGAFNNDFPDFRYDTYFENRNLETRLDGSIGYKLTPLISLWNGFTWISPNRDQLPLIYRPWQQVTWEIFKKNRVVMFQTRTRLEELKQEYESQWALRLRERWRIALPQRLPHKFTPVVYDEIFFNLTRPAWLDTGTLDQNWFFAGVDTPTWHKTFVEMGYLNQYIFSEPVQRMAHTVYVAFMIQMS